MHQQNNNFREEWSGLRDGDKWCPTNSLQKQEGQPSQQQSEQQQQQMVIEKEEFKDKQEDELCPNESEGAYEPKQTKKMKREEEYSFSNEKIRKSVLKKENNHNYENQIFSITPLFLNSKKIHWNEETEELEIPKYQDITAKYLIHGIKSQFKYSIPRKVIFPKAQTLKVTHSQFIKKIFEGEIKLIKEAELSTLSVAFNSLHEREELQIIPKIIFARSPETKGLDYFIKRPLLDSIRHISQIIKMQKSQCMRFFGGWVEAKRKEEQDRINELSEDMLENKYILEFERKDNYLIQLCHCEHVLEGISELEVKHTNYKIITQMVFTISLPNGYYDKFIHISEFV